MLDFTRSPFHNYYDIYNDPKLATTSRNFEFRYTCRNQLDHAIHKYHKKRATELANARAEKQPKTMPKFCKVKCTEHDVCSMYKSKDQDVETMMSRQRDMDMSETSLQEMQEFGQPPCRSNPSRTNNKLSISSTLQKLDTTCDDKETYRKQTNRIEALHNEICKQLERINNAYNLPKKNVNPSNTSKEAAPSTKAQGRSSPKTSEVYPEPQAKWVELVHSTGMAEKVDVDICESTDSSLMENASYTTDYEFIETHADNCIDHDKSAYILEDSDLEFKLKHRSKCMKNFESKLHEQFADGDGVDTMPLSVESEEMPGMNSNFLKNNKQKSRMYQTCHDLKAILNNNTQKCSLISVINHQSPSKQTKRKTERYKQANKNAQIARTLAASRGTPLPCKNQKARNYNEIYGCQQTQMRPGAKLQKHDLKKMAVNVPTTGRAKPLTTNAIKDTKRKNKGKDVKHIKSIEELKIEKLSIYNKMAITQERIIRVIDEIRYSLLQIQIPDCKYEKSKRQRNAFEFCVRFSRNFLYPLKGMIDNIRKMSPDKFNSAISNDACFRVSAIYSLIYQSLTTYQRQLRYFLLDQVPQKLSALLEMIYTMTCICLQKGLFDKQDAIIECIQERCTQFLHFIEDMQEERFIQIRERFRKQSEKSQYDLKMCMNDLNVYEPKLVPKTKMQNSKRLIRKMPRKAVKQPQERVAKFAPLGKHLKYAPAIKTHTEDKMQCKTKRATTDQFINGQTAMQELPLPTTGTGIQQYTAVTERQSCHENLSLEDANAIRSLNLVLIDALQLVTKKQVHQLIQPIIKSLDGMLDKKSIPELLHSAIQEQQQAQLSRAATTNANENKQNTNKETIMALGTANESKTNSQSPQTTSKALSVATETKIWKQPTKQVSRAVAKADVVTNAVDVGIGIDTDPSSFADTTTTSTASTIRIRITQPKQQQTELQQQRRPDMCVVNELENANTNNIYVKVNGNNNIGQYIDGEYQGMDIGIHADNRENRRQKTNSYIDNNREVEVGDANLAIDIINDDYMNKYALAEDRPQRKYKFVNSTDRGTRFTNRTATMSTIKTWQNRPITIRTKYAELPLPERKYEKVDQRHRLNAIYGGYRKKNKYAGITSAYNRENLLRSTELVFERQQQIKLAKLMQQKQSSTTPRKTCNSKSQPQSNCRKTAKTTKTFVAPKPALQQRTRAVQMHNKATEAVGPHSMPANASVAMTKPAVKTMSTSTQTARTATGKKVLTTQKKACLGVQSTSAMNNPHTLLTARKNRKEAETLLRQDPQLCNSNLIANDKQHAQAKCTRIRRQQQATAPAAEFAHVHDKHSGGTTLMNSLMPAMPKDQPPTERPTLNNLTVPLTQAYKVLPAEQIQTSNAALAAKRKVAVHLNKNQDNK